MNQRIREVRKLLKMNQRDFAKKIGLKQNAISYIEKPGTHVTDSNIKLICTQFNVNESWLIDGSGEIFNENKNYNQFYEIFKQLEPRLQEYLMKTAAELLDAQEKIKQ